MKSPLTPAALALVCSALLGLAPASAQNAFTPGDILVSSSTYAGTASTIVAGQTVLPYNSGVTATNNGTYYQVFNNDTPDPNFGITSPITFTELTPTGSVTGVTINVPQSYLTTSFSSKSELGLSLSSDGTVVTFMGYPAVANQIDLSNSATPNNNFSGNTDTAAATYRAIGQLNANGTLSAITQIVDYSGDNARNAILASNGYYYTAGASASSNIALAGAELITPGGTPGSNSVSLGTYGTKDSQNNFRGLTIFNNTVYVSKGSGGANTSVDTVYQVGTAGTLPTGSTTISIVPGFNTTTQSGIGANGPHPFGLWFANASTFYVADEGTGLIADIQSPTTGLASLNGNNQYAGLEKWSFNSSTHKWVLDYTLTSGLNIGTNYTVSGTSGGVSGSYTTAPDGLRNIAGKLNGDGTVTIYAITSTASAEGGIVSGAAYATNNAADEGCDPNQLVSITDNLSYTTASQASSETFALLQTAAYGQVLRGVSFVPQQPTPDVDTPTMPQWGLIGLGALLFSLAAWFIPTRRLAFQS